MARDTDKSMYHLRWLYQRLLFRLGLSAPASEALTILKDDTFIVSYPKSGNTWVRFLLGQIRAQQVLDFRSLEFIIPDIYQNSDR